jgi:serine/threonine protein kinase
MLHRLGRRSFLAYHQQWYILNWLCLIPREYVLANCSYSEACIQVFSGCLPWHDSKSGDIINELRQRRVPSRPGGGGIDDSLWNFITCCCSFIPRDRPSATQILEFFEHQYKPSKVNISPDDLTEMLCNIPRNPTVSGGFADIRKCTLKKNGKTKQVGRFSIKIGGYMNDPHPGSCQVDPTPRRCPSWKTVPGSAFHPCTLSQLMVSRARGTCVKSRSGQDLCRKTSYLYSELRDIFTQFLAAMHWFAPGWRMAHSQSTSAGIRQWNYDRG